MRIDAAQQLLDRAGAPFSLEVYDERGGRVREGRLHGAGESFPIVGGVPRIVRDPELRGRLARRFPGFEAAHGAMFTGGATPLESRARRTVIGFGEEWEKFDAMLGDYQAQAARYFSVVPDADLAGRRVLDAGCGMGRWAHYAASRAREIWAVDLSFAVDVAARTLEAFDNANVVQADIHDLPFGRDSFDLIYSFGVLHHLPDPIAGFDRLVPLTRPGGRLFVYIYYALETRPAWYRMLFHASHGVRRVTSALPPPAVHAVAAVFAAGSYGLFVLPARGLGRVGATRLVKHFPLGAYADKSFRYVYLNTVDRFGTPIEHRYTLDQIRRWFTRAGFQVVAVADDAPFWRVLGERPGGTGAR